MTTADITQYISARGRLLSRAAISPAARRWLRGGAVAAFVLGCLIALAVTAGLVAKQPLGSLHKVGEAWYPRDDFVAYYSAGRMAREGRGAFVYDLQSIGAEEFQATGQLLPEGFTMPFFNPPHALLLLAPLSLLPIRTAGVIWTAGGVLLFAIGLGLLLATYRRRISPWPAAVGILGIFASAPFLLVVTLGQFSLLVGLGICLLFVSLRRPHPAYPILGLLLLSLKPWLLPLPLLFLLLRGRWRMLAVFAGVLELLIFATMALAGPHIPLDWLRLTSQASLWENQYTVSSFHQVSWVGLLGALLGPEHIALRRLVVSGLGLLTTLVAGLLIYNHRRDEGSQTALFSLAMVGALGASANLNPWDLLLLVPVLLALYQSREIRRETVARLAAAGWVVAWLFLAVLETAFQTDYPSMGLVRQAHANAAVVALSHVNLGAMYLLVLLVWLASKSIKPARQNLGPIGVYPKEIFDSVWARL
ncbi:MAG TPA: glycosyltransferase family 87 protein [Dehalococcoidia bacterium]|nr:glycosyltransferase family 87 protein [Dehalococcoidia bacterium]